MRSLFLYLALCAIFVFPAQAAEKGGNLDGLIQKIKDFRLTRNCENFTEYCATPEERLSQGPGYSVNEFKNRMSVEEGLPSYYREEYRQIIHWCCEE